MGSDASSRISFQEVEVSIHAPAWGATSSKTSSSISPQVSIHAPAWGATADHHQRCPVVPRFQFTLPRGERHSLRPRSHLWQGFNSRSRVGSDRPRRRRRRAQRCFNSRSRVGSDRGRSETVADGGVSIHAPAWGATDGGRRDPKRPRVSIHAPAWGATSVLVAVLSGLVFQFTLPRGERHALIWNQWFRDEFQFTLPRGERRR